MNTYAFKELFGVEFGAGGKAKAQYSAVNTAIFFLTPNNSEDSCTFGNTHGAVRVGIMPKITILDLEGNEVVSNFWRVDLFVADDGVDPVTKVRVGTGAWEHVAPKNRAWLLPNTEYFLRLEPHVYSDSGGEPVAVERPELELTCVYTGRDGNEVSYDALEAANDDIHVKLDRILEAVGG
jgi:hypothetical protein